MTNWKMKEMTKIY